ncbi:MAG: hypothetical protein F6K41_44070 [Symploca sp. SIO3E6]|nr:hypothetical protein [Caldora sp. SIO3E6]
MKDLFKQDFYGSILVLAQGLVQEGRRQKAEGRREESLCSKLFHLF